MKIFRVYKENKLVMSDLKYNYVWINGSYLLPWIINKKDFLDMMVRDIEGVNGIELIRTPFQQYPTWIRFLYYLHVSKKINNIINLPFKQLWLPKMFHIEFDENKPLCFIFLQKPKNEKIYKFLKKRYKNCKFVSIYLDVLKVSMANCDLEKIRRYYDLEFSYNELECQQYNLLHLVQIASRIDPTAYLTENNKENIDVFFAGKAKERLGQIIQAYDRLESQNIRCKFIISGVLPKNRIKRRGITYINNLMLYGDLMPYIINCKCLLDINQKGTMGYTYRVIEAVMYNKKLISDNSNLLNHPYYNNDYMQIVEDMSKINCDFVKKKLDIDFNYKDEFSPINLIRRIDKLL